MTTAQTLIIRKDRHLDYILKLLDDIRHHEPNVSSLDIIPSDPQSPVFSVNISCLTDVSMMQRISGIKKELAAASLESHLVAVIDTSVPDPLPASSAIISVCSEIEMQNTVSKHLLAEMSNEDACHQIEFDKAGSWSAYGHIGETAYEITKLGKYSYMITKTTHQVHMDSFDQSDSVPSPSVQDPEPSSSQSQQTIEFPSIILPEEEASTDIQEGTEDDDPRQEQSPLDTPLPPADNDEAEPCPDTEPHSSSPTSDVSVEDSELPNSDTAESEKEAIINEPLPPTFQESANPLIKLCKRFLAFLEPLIG